ncbi:hypothetical protein, partial [Bradyrhizobium sp.]|uniref:hypothetical protein n=1 Tax=Bradyrhizobium sp. TaxID=376 RepID=UPI003C6EDABB
MQQQSRILSLVITSQPKHLLRVMGGIHPRQPFDSLYPIKYSVIEPDYLVTFGKTMRLTVHTD